MNLHSLHQVCREKLASSFHITFCWDLFEEISQRALGHAIFAHKKACENDLNVDILVVSKSTGNAYCALDKFDFVMFEGVKFLGQIVLIRIFKGEVFSCDKSPRLEPFK